MTEDNMDELGRLNRKRMEYEKMIEDNSVKAIEAEMVRRKIDRQNAKLEIISTWEWRLLVLDYLKQEAGPHDNLGNRFDQLKINVDDYLKGI